MKPNLLLQTLVHSNVIHHSKLQDNQVINHNYIVKKKKKKILPSTSFYELVLFSKPQINRGSVKFSNIDTV